MDEPVVHEEDGRPTYGRGKKIPAFALVAVPFLALIAFLRKHVRGVHWPSVVVLVVLFEGATLFVEHNAVTKGHWIYNINKILGPTLFGVPIEEPLIYYVFPPIMVVLIFHWFVGLWKKGP